MLDGRVTLVFGVYDLSSHRFLSFLSVFPTVKYKKKSLTSILPLWLYKVTVVKAPNDSLLFSGEEVVFWRKAAAAAVPSSRLYAAVAAYVNKINQVGLYKETQVSRILRRQRTTAPGATRESFSPSFSATYH